jgi:uncharacterized protein YkuJ
MGMGDDPNQDMNAWLPPQRPDCVFLLVMEHLEKLSSTRTMSARYFELRGLIVASVEYIEDQSLRTEIERALANPKNNLNINIIRNYKAEIAAGTPYTVVFECEFSRLIPIMETLWTRTQSGLIEQQLLPWTISDSKQQLRDIMIDKSIDRLSAQRNRDIAFGPSPRSGMMQEPRLVKALPESVEQAPIPEPQPKRAVNEFEDYYDPHEYDTEKTPPSTEITEADAKEIGHYAEKTVKSVEAMATKPQQEDLPEPKQILNLARKMLDLERALEDRPDEKVTVEKVENELPTASEPRETIDLVPIERLRPRLPRLIRTRAQSECGLLPKDYQVPPDIDENVMGDFPDDDEIDYDTYMATDQELEDASHEIKRFLRKKKLKGQRDGNA